MNTTKELKLDIFRKNDNLNDSETLEAYNKLLSLIDLDNLSEVNPIEKKAISIGISHVKEGKVSFRSHEKIEG